jgi:hypothetical protein
MPLLNRDQILAAEDIKTEPVNVPEWGGDVLVRAITRNQRDAFEDGLAKGKGKNRQLNMQNFSAKLLAICLVDEAGKCLFAPEDVEALGEKAAAPMQRCLDVATRLCGYSDAEIKDLVEGDAKN